MWFGVNVFWTLNLPLPEAVLYMWKTNLKNWKYYIHANENACVSDAMPDLVDMLDLVYFLIYFFIYIIGFVP